MNETIVTNYTHTHIYNLFFHSWKTLGPLIGLLHLVNFYNSSVKLNVYACACTLTRSGAMCMTLMQPWILHSRGLPRAAVTMFSSRMKVLTGFFSLQTNLPFNPPEGEGEEREDFNNSLVVYSLASQPAPSGEARAGWLIFAHKCAGGRVLFSTPPPPSNFDYTVIIYLATSH